MSVANHLHTRRNPAKPGRCRGDTMIEVLVTVLILAVGVLGVAAMQVTTLKNLSSSRSASVAEIYAEDFSERIRANPVAALANSYVHSTAPGTFPDCVANACSLTDLAAYDTGTWWQLLAQALPSASGQVTRIAATDTFVVTVRWDDDRSGSSGTSCPVVSAGDLDCFQFNVSI